MKKWIYIFFILNLQTSVQKFYSQKKHSQLVTPIITKTKAGFQYDFSNFSAKQGLPASNSFDVIQIKNGNYWIASDVGVCIYNGVNFKPFKPAGENAIWCLLQDSKDNVWMGGNNGAMVYNGLKLTNLNDTNNLGKSSIIKIIESKSKKIWMAAYRLGVVCIDNGKISIINKCGTKHVKLVYSVYEDKNGLIWIGDKTGVYNIINGELVPYNTSELVDTRAIFQDYLGNFWFGVFGKGLYQKTKTELIKYSEQNGAIKNNSIWSITADDKNNIWCATDDGIITYNGNNFTTITEKQGLINNRTWSVKKDNLGRMLIASYGGGVSIYNGDKFKYINSQTGFTDKSISHTIKDFKNNYWFCTYGDGIIKYDGEYFTSYNFNNNPKHNLIWWAYQDDNGIIWFTTDEGLLKYENEKFTRITTKKNPSSDFFWALAKNKDGTFYVGSYLNGLLKFDGDSFKLVNSVNKISNRILQLLIDKNQNLWINADTKTALLNPNGLLTVLDTNNGILNNTTSHIYEDKRGYIWLCARNGISLITKPKTLSGIYLLPKNKNNIPDVIFSNIESINDSNIWIATNKGILKLNYCINSKTITVNSPIIFYNQTNGFKDIECKGTSNYYANENNHWFGTGTGATIISGEKEKQILPNIHITSIDLFYQAINWNNNSKLKYDSLKQWQNVPSSFSATYKNNHFTFHFLGGNNRTIQNLMYSFKLEGFDNNWSEANNRSDATYSNLQQGTYTFKAKCINELGIESKITQISFQISPPIWQTWWFRILSTLVFSLLIFSIIKYRTNTLVKRKKELEIVVAERTKELREQKHVIEEKQKEIIDSIKYAKQIQKSMLPSDKYINKNINRLNK